MRQFIVYALTIFGLISAQIADACSPSTYCADQTVDQLPADPNAMDCPVDGSCTGRCSLREAILRLNTGCGGTINIQPGTYAMGGTVADRGEDSAAVGDFDINDDIEIQGAGASSTIIDGGGIDRLFDVQSGAGNRLTIKDVTIRNGAADQHGGGIKAFADLIIEDSIVSGNSSGFNGGGIALTNPATVILRNSLVSDNESLVSGGGLGSFGMSGSIVIENSTISGNRTDGPGGGVSTSGPLRFYNVTITGNRADDDRSGDLGDDGGGFFMGGGVLESHNSIIANNVDAGGINIPDCAIAGATYDVASDYNILGTSDGCSTFFGHAGDQTGSIASPLNAGLSSLGDHGGETPTHSLLSGSPAINHGDPAGCKDDGGSDFTADQRGFARPVAGRCDVGAYENGICGDGFVEMGVEACDDGNADDSDACLSTCVSSTCGDGVVQSGVEECDDRAGNSDSSADACRTDCTNPRCGDGVVDTGEECDDANAIDGDGCSAACESESAGTTGGTGGSGGCSLIR